MNAHVTLDVLYATLMNNRNVINAQIQETTRRLNALKEIAKSYDLAL